MSRPAAANGSVTLAIVTAILVWGGNNVGMKVLVRDWPLLFTGSTRFLFAGAFLVLVLRLVPKLAGPGGIVLTPLQRRHLWIRGGIPLAGYCVLTHWCLVYIPASHFSLCLAASPAWALLWEDRFRFRRDSATHYLGIMLTLVGVVVLLWPSLTGNRGEWFGELLAVASGIVWVIYNQSCRVLSQDGLSGIQTAGSTMWRAGAIVAAPAIFELVSVGPFPVTATTLGIQAYCIIGGGTAYMLWNWALSHWPVSRVSLVGNLNPVSTMVAAWLLIGEKLSANFFVSLALILGGVFIGQFSKTRAKALRAGPEA